MEEIQSEEFGWDDWEEKTEIKIDDATLGPVANFAFGFAVPPTKQRMMDELCEVGIVVGMYNRWIAKELREFLKKLSGENIKFEDVASPVVRIAAEDKEAGIVEFIESRMRTEEVQTICKVSQQPIVTELLFNAIISLLDIIRPSNTHTLISSNHYILISHLSIDYSIQPNGIGYMKIRFHWIPFKK